jgi:hypothetical protein
MEPVQAAGGAKKMSECFGVKIEAEGLNDARLEDVRDALCTEWDIEEGEVHFEPQPNRTAKMVAVTAGGPSQMESEAEFCERIAQVIWRANKTFCPVCIRIEDAANVRAFRERDYQRIVCPDNG